MILPFMGQEYKQKCYLILQHREKAQIACQIQMKIGAYACSSIHFFISCIQTLPDYVHAFYECFRRAVAKLNDS